jgi:hypothetical protein
MSISQMAINMIDMAINPEAFVRNAHKMIKNRSIA